MTGIILLVIYTVVMLAVTFKDRAGDSLAFNVANRNIGTWSGALSIAATWIWAPALFVSAEKSYSWGWQGLAESSRLAAGKFSSVSDFRRR